MEKNIEIHNAEKMLIGMQLICENVDSVINSKLTSNTNKYKLKNLANQCERFIDKFWNNFDDIKIENEFQEKVLLIEKTFDNTYLK